MTINIDSLCNESSILVLHDDSCAFIFMSLFIPYS